MFPFVTPWNMIDLSPSELDGMLDEMKRLDAKLKRGRRRG